MSSHFAACSCADALGAPPGPIPTRADQAEEGVARIRRVDARGRMPTHAA